MPAQSAHAHARVSEALRSVLAAADDEAAAEVLPRVTAGEDTAVLSAVAQSHAKLAALAAARSTTNTATTASPLVDVLRSSLRINALAPDQAVTLSAIEDVLDAVPLAAAQAVFAFLAENYEAVVGVLTPGRGKALQLLRTCNALLRRISKGANTSFAGKILSFLASAFPLSERSGVNLRGEFDTENATPYETARPADVSEQEFEMYTTFWSLQRFMADPNSILRNAAAFDEFTTKLTAVTTELAKYAEGRPAAALKATSFATTPKFLTSPALFKLQLKDPFFRRHVLAQFQIVLRYVTAVTDKSAQRPLNGNLRAPANTAITDAQAGQLDAAKNATAALVDRLGKPFFKALNQVFLLEENWISWKNSGCPSFEKQPADVAQPRPQLPQAELLLRPLSAAARADSSRVGAAERKWPTVTAGDMQQWKKAKSIPQLADWLQVYESDIDPSNDIEPQYRESGREAYRWRLYRIATDEACQLARRTDGVDVKKLHGLWAARRNKRAREDDGGGSEANGNGNGNGGAADVSGTGTGRSSPDTGGTGRSSPDTGRVVLTPSPAPDKDKRIKTAE